MIASPKFHDVQHLVSRLRFRHLRLLIELQRVGSLRAASEELGLTQPALSKALAEIESAFGFEMFTRSSRGLVATERGTLAIRGAGSLLEELARIGIETSSTPATTLLRLGAPPFVAQGYIPSVLASARERGIKASFQLVEERVPLLMQLLVAGKLDALISSYPTDMTEAKGTPLKYEKLFDSDFAVIASSTHPLVNQPRVRWQQLVAQAWIMPSRASLVRRLLEDVFRHQGIAIPMPIIESTSPVTNYRLAAAGLGITAIPGDTWRALRADGLVGTLDLEPAIASGPVALIYRVASDRRRLALVREILGLD